jgi:putative polyhydroxyalkanoate system protein
MCAQDAVLHILAFGPSLALGGTGVGTRFGRFQSLRPWPPGGNVPGRSVGGIEGDPLLSIDVTRSHSLGKAAAREGAARVAERLRSEFGIQYRWQGDYLRFSRPGASGYVLVQDAAVQVSVSLGLLLLPMKAEIAREITDYLDLHFT